MMHIVFLTSEFPKVGYANGGVGTFVFNLSRWLVRHGVNVSVVGINYSAEDDVEQVDGVQVYRIKKAETRGLIWYLNANSISRKLQEIHRRQPIDVVEGSELLFAFIKKIPGVFYLMRLHGGHHFFATSENRGINWWKGFQEKRSFQRADGVVGVSQYVVDHTATYLSFEEKKKGVIWNPTSLNKFYQVDKTKAVKGRIFFAGTVCEKKGVRQLIQAMPLIRQEVPEAHLQIAGRDWFFPGTGESYTVWVKQFIAPEVADAITFLGPVPHEDMPACIEQAEVCCYPSHMEAMPLAWIEVMAMGQAFVASQLGPGPEIITHGKNGLLPNPIDPQDIADCVIKLLKNPAWAYEMGLQARAFALENFSLDTIGQQNIALYRSLL